VPGGANALQHLIKNMETHPLFTGVVDLLAVDDHQLGLGDRALQGAAAAVGHLRQGQLGTGGATDAFLHSPLAGLGIENTELARTEALDDAPIR
jgi:hypothetical protein